MKKKIFIVLNVILLIATSLFFPYTIAKYTKSEVIVDESNSVWLVSSTGILQSNAVAYNWLNNRPASTSGGNYTATFTAPYAGWYAFSLWGGAGAQARYRTNSSVSIRVEHDATGGKGGIVVGAVYLTAGQVLYIWIGNGGFRGATTRDSMENMAAYPNGGDLKSWTNDASSPATGYGAGGGGASAIATNNTSLSGATGYRTNNTGLIAVAGGGGGGGVRGAYGGNGGDGGGVLNGAGTANGSNGKYGTAENAGAGKGGTGTAGGAAGTNNAGRTATAGSFLQGGDGRNAGVRSSSGGGGGYYGGGGSTSASEDGTTMFGCGAGGGSSYAASTVQALPAALLSWSKFSPYTDNPWDPFSGTSTQATRQARCNTANHTVGAIDINNKDGQSLYTWDGSGSAVADAYGHAGLCVLAYIGNLPSTANLSSYTWTINP
ncbi:MAG: hypothetical protein LBQ80_04420 [Clostridium sp.]|jgi:hypothetical protein|nr:hypothetical protein [Clostridium sp.]